MLPMYFLGAWGRPLLRGVRVKDRPLFAEEEDEDEAEVEEEDVNPRRGLAFLGNREGSFDNPKALGFFLILSTAEEKDGQFLMM